MKNVITIWQYSNAKHRSCWKDEPFHELWWPMAITKRIEYREDIDFGAKDAISWEPIFDRSECYWTYLLIFFQIKIPTNVKGIWAIVTKTPIAPTLKGLMTALATLGTKEMASTALVINDLSKILRPKSSCLPLERGSCISGHVLLFLSKFNC